MVKNTFSAVVTLSFLLALWQFDVGVNAQNADCDYYQQMQLNTNYYVYSPGYSDNYPAGTSCRWFAQAPANSRITLTCNDVNIPASPNCSGDRLLISASGRTDLSDAQRYCGTGNVTITSSGNAINIVLQATANSQGGRFLCSLVAANTVSSCDCGWKKSNRIVGGTPTGVNEYPMMAGLVDRINQIVYCGGTIISERYVATAAHCVLNRATTDFAILVGDDDITEGQETSAARMYRVEFVRIHERFDTTTYQNDIAILRTSQTIQFSQEVGPACLPFNYRGSNFAGATVTALGWGTTGFGEAPSDKLLKVQLVVQTNANCAKSYPNRLTNEQVCTYADGKDSCQNDSGGPLCFENNSARVYLVGIISYSQGCATKIPGVNTRVTSYIDWIQQNTPDATYCVK